MNSILSLKNYIDHYEEYTALKVHTFCRLMKYVSDAIEKDGRAIIKINLDDIQIDVERGEIILPDSLFKTDVMDKTMAELNTGISVLADRKASLENKRVSFALMILGWYVNEDGSSILSDLEVLENFDSYMEKVPLWLHDYFDAIFRKMDYGKSFGMYYDEHFTNKVKEEVRKIFASYPLNEEQFERVMKVVIQVTKRSMKEGGINEKK